MCENQTGRKEKGMNRVERERLRLLLKNVRQIQAGLVAVESMIDMAYSSEQTKLENLPENLENSDLYTRLEEAGELLEDILDNLRDAIKCVEQAERGLVDLT